LVFYFLIVVTRKTRILDVVYNASNNELVRTKTLVKNAIIQVDATPFKQWYEQHYGVKVGVKKSAKKAASAAEKEAEVEVKRSKSVQKKLLDRQKTRTLVPPLFLSLLCSCKADRCQCTAGPCTGRRVQQLPSSGLHLLASWTEWTLRRLHPRGQGARLLRQDAQAR
jgi:hypothetical protein